MFPEPSALYRVVVKAWRKRGIRIDSSQIGLAISGRETLDLKEV